MENNSGLVTVLLVLGIGGAAFLLWRGQQQQQIALQAAASAQAGATPSSGGGAAGLGQRLFQQWKSDPLGIQNTKAIVSGVGSVAGTAVKQVGSLLGSIF